MKKISLTIASLLVASLGYANPASNHHLVGAFNDTYTVYGAHVLSGSIQSGAADDSFSKLNDTQFSIIETEQFNPFSPPPIVTSVVSLGQDSAHQCTLTILDADFQQPQLQSQSCVGGYSLISFNPNQSYTAPEIHLKQG